jgi:L,D-transpeptidase catalytic domain
MVKMPFTMKWFASAIGVGAVVLALGSLVLPDGIDQRAQAQDFVIDGSALPATPVVPPKPAGPPPVSEVLQSGVLIVVSKASQRMYVFKDGVPWASSPVSTGKRGHSTPAGVFPILQKKVFHRSNIYSNAPMPYMQRLTWRGIAIHAGRLPGYAASHGCIRLPHSFARSLFNLTRADATTVVVTNDAVGSDEGAITLALGTQGQVPAVVPSKPEVRLAAAPVRMAFAGPGQTIQLAAAITLAEAEAHWQDLVSQHPELAGFSKAVIPAVVGSRRFYRLRASAPGAHAYCASLKRSGQDCFNVS